MGVYRVWDVGFWADLNRDDLKAPALNITMQRFSKNEGMEASFLGVEGLYSTW